MKKLIAIGLIISGLFASRYPIVAEYYYMNSCVNAGKDKKNQMIDYCACTLEEIEKNYSFSEFVRKMQTNKEAFLKELSQKVIPQCITKLAK